MRTFVRLADASACSEYDEVDLLAAQRSLFPPHGQAPLGVQNPDVQLWHHVMPKGRIGNPDAAADLIERIASAVLDPHQRRGGVYIHSEDGYGRSSAVTACLLGLVYDDVSADEALRLVRCYLPPPSNVDKGIPRGMSEEQEQFVRDYLSS